ncbi:MAG: efflux RND transporter periplasmic adaptor subunit [Anaerolineae bacterium]|nr:efflux RND transporter periplasmic adaptor subunit [Anaerolineae bacterium]
MKLKFVATILVIVLLAGGVIACSPESTETPEPVEVQAIQQPNVVSAEAFVIPVQEANLSFEVGGRVTAVEIEEGDQVAQGQVLAQLDDSTQQAALGQAQASLVSAEAAVAQAEASLDQIKAGATPEEIDQAEAALAQAEAALAEVIAGPTKEDIAQAEARIESAQAALNQVLAGARDEDLRAASAHLLQTEANVRLAQADYDKFIYGEPDVAEPYGVALQQATLEYEAAQAEYEKLVNGATDEDVAIARAGVKEAQAALAKVKAGATPEQIAQAQAEVARAEAALAQILAGATDEQIAVAEAGVVAANAGIQAAEAGVASTQTELVKTELKSPFAGTIGARNVNPGEMVSPGEPVISVGDTSRWQIETDDLTEIDVVNVKEGANVTISVDALPGEEFEGVVVRIKPQSETKAGDVTYTVLIDITKGDTSLLRWGMTTFVDIEVGPEL